MADLAEGIELERPLAADDLDANEAMIMGPSDAQNRERIARYNVEAEENNHATNWIQRCYAWFELKKTKENHYVNSKVL